MLLEFDLREGPWGVIFAISFKKLTQARISPGNVYLKRFGGTHFN